MDYNQFINQKTQLIGDFGFSPNYIPETAFDFQKYIIERDVRKGRFGNFVDTGLGKTLVQLAVAHNIVRHTNKRVLILTPLAVAFQFIQEAEKFNIPDVKYSKDGKRLSQITVTNYERLHHFDRNDFVGVMLDESSILKNFEGKTKKVVTEFTRKIKYRYLSTATPSPNDFTELGTSSEVLGFMGYMDMLSMFFKNNQGSIDIRHSGCKWYLKPHAEKDFWKWVSQWSISVRKPSDIGFSDEKYILPELIENTHIVNPSEPIAVNGQTRLFSLKAKSFHEITAEAKATVPERCEKAVSLARDHDVTVYWVNRNNEASAILRLDSDAYEVSGSMSLDKKEERLIAFAKGDIKKLVTKTKITAFGLNWQHCNHTTYFPDYSYEKYYQAIRRFWRFGQKKEVNVDIVLSDGQTKIMEALQAKKDQAEEMFSMLTQNLNSIYNVQKREFNQEIKKPSFL